MSQNQNIVDGGVSEDILRSTLLSGVLDSGGACFARVPGVGVFACLIVKFVRFSWRKGTPLFAVGLRVSEVNRL